MNSAVDALLEGGGREGGRGGGGGGGGGGRGEEDEAEEEEEQEEEEEEEEECPQHEHPGDAVIGRPDGGPGARGDGRAPRGDGDGRTLAAGAAAQEPRQQQRPRPRRHGGRACPPTGWIWNEDMKDAHRKN
ncbi:unnamed protein product [Prorocentrum cordatum]|uniref:Uncharacterized protein n=1 Tax=Prorocentrum cordatum TaxID=2364126 RepID=A0ABN9PPW5_9DINO|nr:unnamed protein product [Polarella glacialis]